MSFMRHTHMDATNVNRHSPFTVTDVEILIASEVRHAIDEVFNTASIDKKLNVFIMSEVTKYKHFKLRDSVHLSEHLDKSIKDIIAIVAPQVPTLLALHTPTTFKR